MGVTIYYRGVLDDLSRIEDFEDRVIDLVLDMGGHVHVWRSAADERPDRIVRGLIVELFPGQETTSLLISPEGWLIDLLSIESSEKGELTEPPQCFVKTQFGPLEGHVALVELFAALKKQFISNLEVLDEGGYWESRDLAILSRHFRTLHAAIEGLSDGLRQFSLTGEAVEAPQILATRIERIAQQVHKAISRPVEHAPVQFQGTEDDSGGIPLGTEAEWDAMFKDNRRKQERMHRAIEEGMHRGETHRQAFDNAMHDAGILNLPDEIDDADSDAEDDDEICDDDWMDDTDSLDDDLLGMQDDEASDSDQPGAESSSEEYEQKDDLLGLRQRDPLVERAMDLLLEIDKFGKDLPRQSENHFTVLRHGCGEMMGGLAQATGSSDYLGTGLAVVQLKRALRGAAFARGALFPLRSAGVISKEIFDQLYRELEDLSSAMTAKLAQLRERLESGDSG